MTEHHTRKAFGDQLVVVRGNHESYNHAPFAAVPFQRVDLPGAVLAVIDTSIDGGTTGHVTGEQLEWLHDVAAGADRPVYVFGHHHVWSPDSSERPDAYFGIDPDSSVRLVEVVAARHVEYVVRMIGGSLYLSGVLIMIYNLVRTVGMPSSEPAELKANLAPAPLAIPAE